MNKKIFFLPVNTGYGTNGNPSHKLLKFHEERSGNGIYASIVGNVVTPSGFNSNDYCIKISKNNIWSDLSKTILYKGSIPGIQISSAWENYKGNIKFKSDTGIIDYYEVSSSLSLQKIDEIFSDFFDATCLAIYHGFKHIQIHAAHGYIMSLILDNHFHEASTYALDKLRSLLKYIKDNNCESSVRFSMSTGNEKIDINREKFINEILKLETDYFDLSSGFYNINKFLIYPQKISELKSRYTSSVDIAKTNPDKNFIISGKSFRFYDSAVPENTSLGICRDLIANPNFTLGFSDGCMNNKHCHYHSRGENSLNCKKWNL